MDIQKSLQDIKSNNSVFDETVQKIQSGKVYENVKTIDDAIDVFENRYRSLKKITFQFSKLEGSGINEIRSILANEWLQFHKSLSDAIDRKHDFSVPVYRNIAVGGHYPSGIAPKHIKEADIRKDYEERLAKNTQLAKERRVQLILKQMLVDATDVMEEYWIIAYEKEPRADGELLKAVEEYKVPKELRIKILAKLNIPYKNFRSWESTDGLFKTNAKFISLDKKEVTLEKPDGKRTTIDLSVLRKVDQDYVKEQLAPKFEKPKTDSVP